MFIRLLPDCLVVVDVDLAGAGTAGQKVKGHGWHGKNHIHHRTTTRIWNRMEAVEEVKALFQQQSPILASSQGKVR